jgi:uncharacterized protein
MKYLLMIALAVGLLWWWRTFSRRSGSRTRQAPTGSPGKATPQDIVACRHCGLHLPGAEALQGRRGLYCSADHMQTEEGA